MPKGVGSNLDFHGVMRILNLPSPNASHEPATREYVDSILEGLNWKIPVRVAAPANVDLANPGATINGITMVVGDRVLLPSQTSSAQNGIYVWSGASTTLTRSLDANTADELEQAVVTVEEGTSAGATFRQTAINFVLGTDPVNWVSFGTAAPPASETSAGIAEIATQTETNSGLDDARFITPLKLANWSGRTRTHVATIGDGSQTLFTITHNFNTRDVIVAVYRLSGNFDDELVDIERPSVNAIAVRFATGNVPAAGSYRVVIMAV